MRRTLSLLCALGLLALTASAQIIVDPRLPGGRRPGQRLRPLSIKSHVVTVEIDGAIAHTKVRQVFTNPNAMDLEGTWLFPLPADAALDRYALQMGGKMVEGEVLEKDKALTIYTGIVQKMKDPALLEYAGRGTFKARVYPIPARGDAVLEFSFTRTLERSGKLFELRHPYRTQGVMHSKVGTAVIDVKIKNAGGVRTLYSPSHPVSASKVADGEARVGFEASNYAAEKDFVLLFSVSADRVACDLISHAEKKDDGAFLLLLSPSDELDEGEIANKDVVFVVDTSGSMAGEKMEQARRALNYCVKSLRKDDRFEIVSFATESRALFGELMPADAQNKERALEHVKDLNARGGTNIHDALTAAIARSAATDRPLMVIFMTDGEPTIGVTDTQGILKAVKKANAALTRLFVFGIGDKVRTELLDLLAEQNSGTRDYVGDKEDLELKISSFFTKVASPVLTDVKLAFTGAKISSRHPRDLPDLFRGTQLLVAGRYQGSGEGKVRLSGRIGQRRFEQSFDVSFDAQGRKETAYVPRLWAVREVGYLIDQVRLNGKNAELEKEIVRLGKRYGVVTPYTSYLVVEDTPIAGRRPNRWRDARRGGRPLAPGGVRLGFGPVGGGTVPTPAPSGNAAGPGARAGGGAATGRRPATTTATPQLATRSGVPARKPSVDSLLRKEAKKRPMEPDEEAEESIAAGEKSRAKAEMADRAASRERDAAKQKLELSEKLKSGFLGDEIALSQNLKALRESRRADGGGGGVLVRRVGNRTFYLRKGFYVESSLLDRPEKELSAKLSRIKAFSKEWLELAKDKEVAKILALGQVLLFEHGGKCVLVSP